MDDNSSVQFRVSWFRVVPWLRSVRFRGVLFPQIPRFFSASGLWGLPRLFLWGALMMLFALNLHAKTVLLPSYWQPARTALQQPRSLVPHLELAFAYRNTGHAEAARRELRYAQNLATSEGEVQPGPEKVSVLGAFTQPAEVLRAWDREAQDLEANYAHWKAVVGNYPSYRDAYLILAAISYRLGLMSEASEYLAKASSLDPNHPLLNNLLELLR